jgi:hypothetical protein
MDIKRSTWVESESEDGLTGFGMKVQAAMDVDNMQTLLDKLRVAYSALNGQLCWAKGDEATESWTYETLHELPTFSIAQLSWRDDLNWSDNFDEVLYTALMVKVIRVVGSFQHIRIKALGGGRRKEVKAYVDQVLPTAVATMKEMHQYIVSRPTENCLGLLNPISSFATGYTAQPMLIE